MTYRERREAKAERLREWAEKRDAKASAAFSTASQIADAIPLGQPILVGHHSEKHARRDRERIDSGMRRGIENSSKAEEMRSRADNIERAAANAIYSDDPDAIDALKAKIARLEAERERWRLYNASCRAAAKADPESTHGDFSILDAKQKASYLSTAKHCPYQIGKHGEAPGYVSSNLGGVINAAKKRLQRLEA